VSVAGRPSLRSRRVGLPSLDRSATFWVLSVPPLLWLAIFLVAPLLLMAAFSFRADTRGALLEPWAPTLKQYVALAGEGAYLRLLGISAALAAGVALAAVALAYPVAYFLALRAGRRAGLLLILLLVPFWTSYLLRIMAWKLMLGSEGVINSALMASGVISDPLDALLYNRGAVVITLIYVWIPFAALPILAALQRVDVALLEAAADLGARPAAQFWRVTWPLSLPGVLAAFFMVFIPTVGEYVTPLLVGGTDGIMYGNIIQDFFTKAANLPFGSALSMLMVAATVVFVAIGVRVVDVKRFFGE
jgi:spermidine/putrescine transport system permease protein